MQEGLDGLEKATTLSDVTHHFDSGFHEAVSQAAANPRIAKVLRSLEYDVSRAMNR